MTFGSRYRWPRIEIKSKWRSDFSLYWGPRPYWLTIQIWYGKIRPTVTIHVKERLVFDWEKKRNA